MIFRMYCWGFASLLLFVFIDYGSATELGCGLGIGHLMAKGAFAD